MIQENHKVGEEEKQIKDEDKTSEVKVQQIFWRCLSKAPLAAKMASVFNPHVANTKPCSETSMRPSGKKIAAVKMVLDPNCAIWIYFRMERKYIKLAKVKEWGS